MGKKGCEVQSLQVQAQAGGQQLFEASGGAGGKSTSSSTMPRLYHACSQLGPGTHRAEQHSQSPRRLEGGTHVQLLQSVL